MRLLLVLALIGSSFYNVDVRAQESTNAQEEDLWVEVEPQNLLPSDITGVYFLIPYRNRRDKWGHTVSVGYSSFTPINYEPNFITANYNEIYKASDLPLLELQYAFKRNMKIGSLGIEAAVGMYQNGSDTDLIDSELQLIPIRLGAVLRLDNLFYEPFVVPYGSIGAYTMLYEESVTTGQNAYGGNTQISYYYSVGLEFQLNWIDKEAGRVSYLESGIENTFLYVDAKQFFEAQAAQDPDFSTGLDWGAGVRLEF